MGNIKGVIHDLKFNFAGSGDIAWRKVDQKTGIVPKNQQNSLMVINSTKPDATDYEFMDKQAMERMYGKFLKPCIWVKSKEKQKNGYKIKTDEYTLPGVHGGHWRIFGGSWFTGWFDTGDLSIENTRKVVMPVIKNAVDKFLKEKDCVKVLLRLKGHSRGGVVANMLSSSLSQIYSRNKKVELRSVTFDPVPGPEFVSDSSVSEKYNIDLKFCSNSAVVFSLYTG